MPSLVAPPATERADGYVYGVIRAGRGLMPSYGARMSHDERWAVVTYVNSLQNAAGVVQPAAAQPAAGDTVPSPQPAVADTVPSPQEN
jgi:mono/diheme cytochrome c family protein